MRTKHVIQKMIIGLLSRLPASLRWLTTRMLLESEGIGWGASTTELEAKHASRILSDLHIKNPIAFDIGANIGNWSNAFVKFSPNAISYAFEPSAETFRQLSINTQENKSIFPINAGMGEKIGTAKLFTDAEGSGLASLSSRRLNHFNIFMNKSEVVNLTTVDDFIREREVLPSIVKLDVEGHELDVLLGSAGFISKIPVFQFEFGGCNLDTKTTFQDFWYFFTDRSFLIYRLGPRGVVLVKSYYEIYEIYKTTNYFAINQNYKPDNLA
jgi:FkbM family methyltransferase